MAQQKAMTKNQLYRVIRQELHWLTKSISSLTSLISATGGSRCLLMVKPWATEMVRAWPQQDPDENPPLKVLGPMFLNSFGTIATEIEAMRAILDDGKRAAALTLEQRKYLTFAYLLGLIYLVLILRSIQDGWEAFISTNSNSKVDPADFKSDHVPLDSSARRNFLRFVAEFEKVDPEQIESRAVQAKTCAYLDTIVRQVMLLEGGSV